MQVEAMNRRVERPYADLVCPCDESEGYRSIFASGAAGPPVRLHALR
jgi:hypothetical protein